MKGFALIMIGVLLSIGMFGSTAFAATQKCEDGEIELNTSIPFLGRCIEKTTNAGKQGKATLGNAFPNLVGGLIRVVMAAVVVVGFLAILVGGFMVALEGAAQTKQKGLQLIKLAIAGLILVGTSGIILNLINPNFFKTNTGDQGLGDSGVSGDEWVGGDDESGQGPGYGDTA